MSDDVSLEIRLPHWTCWIVRWRW